MSGEQTSGEQTSNDRSQRRAFIVNRVLVVLSVAAILLGLSFDHWYIVLRNACLL